jgi:hypothetical protein
MTGNFMEGLGTIIILGAITGFLLIAAVPAAVCIGALWVLGEHGIVLFSPWWGALAGLLPAGVFAYWAVTDS